MSVAHSGPLCLGGGRGAEERGDCSPRRLRRARRDPTELLAGFARLVGRVLLTGFAGFVGWGRLTGFAGFVGDALTTGEGRCTRPPVATFAARTSVRKARLRLAPDGRCLRHRCSPCGRAGGPRTQRPPDGHPFSTLPRPGFAAKDLPAAGDLTVAGRAQHRPFHVRQGLCLLARRASIGAEGTVRPERRRSRAFRTDVRAANVARRRSTRNYSPRAPDPSDEFGGAARRTKRLSRSTAVAPRTRQGSANVNCRTGLRRRS